MRKLIPYMAVFMAVSLALVLSACNTTGERTSTRPETQMDRSQVEQLVKDRFNSDPQLSGADIGVNVDPANKEIRLSGTVESEEIRNKAVQTARNAVSGFNVTDNIQVQPGEMARAEFGEQRANEERQIARDRGDNLGHSIEDAYTHSKIVLKLWGSKIDHRNLNIDVNNGMVTLRGTVPSSTDKTQLEQLVQGIEGVRQVNNQLQVAGPQGQMPMQRQGQGSQTPYSPVQ